MRPEAHRLHTRHALLVLSLLAFLPAQAATQGILGKLIDEEAGLPVAAAQVALTDAAGNVVGRVLSGASGRFFMAVDVGTYSLVVQRLGYEPEHIADIQITNTSVLPLRILLSPDAVELPGLIVQGERSVPLLRTSGFYERKERGFGHHIEVKESRRLQTFESTDLLRRIPGLRFQDGEVSAARIDGGRSRCLLQVMVDGMHRGVNLNKWVFAHEIEAIEVYKGPATVPARWRGLAARGAWNLNTIPPTKRPTCGLIVVWTRY